MTALNFGGNAESWLSCLSDQHYEFTILSVYVRSLLLCGVDMVGFWSLGVVISSS